MKIINSIKILSRVQRIDIDNENRIFDIFLKILDKSWQEFEITNIRNLKTKNTNESALCIKIKFFIKFFNLNHENFETKLSLDNLYESENFYTFVIDEYIIGRKNGFSLNPYEISWSKFAWKNLEKIYGLIFKETKDNNNFFFMYLASMKCFRYDLFLNNFNYQKILNLIKRILKSGGGAFTRYNFIFIKRILTKIYYLSKKMKEDGYLKKQDNEHLFKNFFLGKVFEFDKFLKNNSLSMSYNEVNSKKWLRKIKFKKFLNLNFFFQNKYSRSYIYLIKVFLFENLRKELYDYKALNFSKNLINVISKKNKTWSVIFKMYSTVNLIKMATVFCLGNINFRTNRSVFFNKNLAIFDKMSLWTKYITGVSLSAVFSGNKSFYKNFYNLIKNNDNISNYLKAGIFTGICLTKNETFEFEKCFFDLSKYLIEKNVDPILKYSACLAISMYGKNKIENIEKSQIFFCIKNLITSDTISSQSASLAIGILFIGSNSSYLLETLISLIQETDCEKTIKNLMISLSLIFFKTRDESDLVFQILINERNSKIREGAVWIHTLAYLGSGNYRAVDILLKIMSFDPDDNVKKTASIGIGFVFMGNFGLIKQIYDIVLKHYNPFVRYGLCFSIAISGLGYPENSDIMLLLVKLSKDDVDFVRQGAFISIGLIFQKKNTLGKKMEILKDFRSIIKDENESFIVKFGVIIAYGIIESDNRFLTEEMPKGADSEKYIIGLVNFLLYWNWIPNLSFFYLMI